MLFRQITVEEVIERHTEEIKERVDENIEMAQHFVGGLTDREKKIFEMGFGAGYMLGVDEQTWEEAVDVLK